MRMKRGIASLAFLTALITAPQAVLAHGGHGGTEEESTPKPPAVLSVGAPAPFLNLPESFTKSVRGCTTDGHVVKLFYNMAVNNDDLSAARNTRLVPDQKARLGATGGDTHLEQIKTMTATIHAAMQEQIGTLLDNTPSKDLSGAAFTKALENATQKIMDDTKTNHQMGVILKTTAPHKTGETCPAAP